MISPPSATTDGKPDLHAPLSWWDRFATYPSHDSCQKDLDTLRAASHSPMERKKLEPKLNNGGVSWDAYSESLAVSLCVRSDDSRLEHRADESLPVYLTPPPK
jgi:hypothetical protein